jgi:hypothetical protein
LEQDKIDDDAENAVEFPVTTVNADGLDDGAREGTSLCKNDGFEPWIGKILGDGTGTVLGRAEGGLLSIVRTEGMFEGIPLGAYEGMSLGV